MSRIQLPFVILFLIVSVLFFAPDQTATAQNVNIPDANLRRFLEKKLSKKAGDAITQAEMASIKKPWAPDLGIRNLTGLEFATNMTHLNLHGNEISDISPLQGLVKLTHLVLSRNEISDFSPIAGLIDNLDLYVNDEQRVPAPSWDVNEDGNVDILDLTAVSQNFGTAAPAIRRADVNGDGTVDILDLVAVANHFGERTMVQRTCFVGMTLKPGEGCRYSGFDFDVRQNGRACLYNYLGNGNLFCGGTGVNVNNFSASKNGDGTWTINGF